MSSPQPTRTGSPFLVVLLAVGLLAVGGAGGWALNDLSGHSTRPVRVTVVNGQQEAARTSADLSAPDLTGLDENGARQALAAIGAGPGRVKVDVVPAAGTPGLVVGQNPAPATPVGDTTTFTLRLSAATTVPNLSGQSEENARKALLGLGARVSRKEAYAPTASAGEAVGTDPAAGQPLTGDVVLVVAQSPSSVYINTLDAVSSDCSTGSSTINGTSYAQGLRCSPGSNPSVNEYTLGRRAGRFEATFGMDDRSSDQRPARLRVLLDGREVASVTVPFGKQVPVAADLRGGLRLRLEVSVAAPPDTNSCCSSPTVVLGDARLVGAPSDIDALIHEAGR